MGGASSGGTGLSPTGLRAAVIVALAAANLFVLAFSASSLQQSRRQHELRAGLLTRNTAEAIDQSVSASIERIDLALRAIVDDLEVQLAGRGLDDRRTGAQLERYQQRLPEVEAIRIANADGFVIYGKGLKPQERPSWADRDYFIHLRDHADAGLQVSKPRIGRVAKTPIVGLARRYNHPDGRFAGVVSAPVAVDYFARLLGRFSIGPRGTAVLRDADLGLIARHPPIAGDAGTIGHSAVSTELRDVVASGAASATYHTRRGADGVERILSFRRLGMAPMSVIVGMAPEDYLADWQVEARTTWAGVAGFALLSLLSGAFALHLLGQVMREREAERRQRLSLARLNEIAALSHLPLAEQLHQALAISTEHLGLDFGIVSRVEGGDYLVVAQVSPPGTLHDGQQFPRGQTYCEITLSQDDVVAITEMGRSPHLGHPCYQAFKLEAYIGAPVRVGGTVFGTVNFSSTNVYHRSFDDGDREFIGLLARWVGSAIERDGAEAQQRLAASVFGHAHEGILICGADGLVVDVNPTFTEITGYRREDIVGRSPKILSSGHQNAEFYQAMWAAIEAQGHWDGEIWNRRRDGAVYAEHLSISSVRDEQGQVTQYIGTFSDISVLKEQQARLEFLAHYDALTRLPNRTLLSDRMTQALAQARRNGHLVAVGYLDLDGFKAINDECGHDGGDALLVEVARRIKEALRAGDTVARLGGDEFVLLLVGVTNADEVDHAAGRVLKALAAPVLIKGRERQVSGSLGITLFPDDDGDPDTLLRHADQAMYWAKQAGKNRYQMFGAGRQPASAVDAISASA